MTNATCLPRGLGEESTTASENFPQSTTRILDAFARHQLDSPLPGAVYHSSFVSRRHQLGAVLLLNNCGPEYGGCAGASSLQDTGNTLPILDTVGGSRGLRVPFGQSEPRDHLKRPDFRRGSFVLDRVEDRTNGHNGDLSVSS